MGRNAWTLLHSDVQVMDTSREVARVSFGPAHLHLSMRARRSQRLCWTCVIAIAMDRRLACVCLLVFVIFRGEEKKK